MAKHKSYNENTQYFRLKTLTILEGLELIKLQQPTVVIDEKVVSANSLRLHCFLTNGIKCVGKYCSHTGTHFAIERGIKISKIERYHINLWAINDSGNEVLMTCDHILARSLGGSNIITNTQTMCSRCNSKKSKDEQKLLATLLYYQALTK